MSGLDEIGIRIEEGAAHANALPVLHEIRHALQRLLGAGEATTIDLRAMPFGPGDEAFLLETLGRGEVQATVEALGPTRIWETAFPGVWVLDYYNSVEERVAFQIEVVELPAILRSDREEIAEGARRLDERLRQLPETG